MSSFSPKDSCSTTTPGEGVSPAAGKNSPASEAPSSRGISRRSELPGMGSDHSRWPARGSAGLGAAQVAGETAKAQPRRHRLLVGGGHLGIGRPGDASANRVDEARLVEVARDRLDEVEMVVHRREMLLHVTV